MGTRRVCPSRLSEGPQGPQKENLDQDREGRDSHSGGRAGRLAGSELCRRYHTGRMIEVCSGRYRIAIQNLLYRAGMKSYGQLARATPEDMIHGWFLEVSRMGFLGGTGIGCTIRTSDKPQRPCIIRHRARHPSARRP